MTNESLNQYAVMEKRRWYMLCLCRAVTRDDKGHTSKLVNVEGSMKTDNKGNKIPEAEDWDYFFKIIKPQFDKKGLEVPPYLEPDAFEGWE